MRKTKIVCTIGPASESVEILVDLITAGMNVARLNFSHGNHEEHSMRIQNIRKASEITGKTVAILLDTKGPEIRTHKMENDGIELEEDAEIIITMDEVLGTKERFSISYAQLLDDVHVGSHILLDDGLIDLEVIHICKEKKEIKTKVINSGMLKNNKGVNVPGVRVNLPGITEKDKKDILFGVEQDVDYIAPSFVRSSNDVLEVRALLKKNNAEHINIIPKIENKEGITNASKILEVSDGMMVARGDLGVEIAAEEVPLVQKELIRKANAVGKPVITATQMLDSMQRNPRPTRAEASDVANAIFDGTDAIMLSGETAAGMYPVESVETMNAIALRIEESLNYSEMLTKRSKTMNGTITDEIGQSVAHSAYNLDVAAIVTPSASGHTARMVSKYRPQAPIIAVTKSESISRKLSLLWGVFAYVGEDVKSTDEMFEAAVKVATDAGVAHPGDLVVITAGVPIGQKGSTNLMKIHRVGDIVAKGQGLGRKSSFGKVVVANTAEEAIRRVEAGSILVTRSATEDMKEALLRVAGLITEDSELTSYGALIGVSLEIPVVIGVENATTVLKDGEYITIEAGYGIIYHGHSKVL